MDDSQFEHRSADTLPLEVLGAATCEDTAITRSRLQALGIPFQETDIDRDPAAAERVAVLNAGHRVTPTLVFGDDRFVVAEPSLERLGELLVQAGYAMEPPRAIEYPGDPWPGLIPASPLVVVGGGSATFDSLRDHRSALLFFGHGPRCLACFGYARQLAARYVELGDPLARAVFVVEGEAGAAASWRDELPSGVVLLADPDGAWRAAVSTHVGLPATALNLLILDGSGALRVGSSAPEAGGLIDPAEAVARLASLS
ncbi:MAG: glutaredoxin domain-containing protein, partial [Candidatus Limnocylindrales bacterium]